MGAENEWNVLVADDDPDDYLLLKQAFQRNGLRPPVHHCLNGAGVISYLRGDGEFADREKFPFPRAVITDLKMPSCSGYEVLQWLQENPASRVAPAIVLSGSADDLDVQRAFALGAHSYFQKPSSFDQLVKLIGRVHEYWNGSLLPEKPAAPKRQS